MSVGERPYLRVGLASLSAQTVTDREGKSVKQESFNSIYMMAESGARGSENQIKQVVEPSTIRP